MNDFQRRLQKAIEDKNITASELSRLSGVGKSDISNYLKGKYLPKQDKCYLLANALNVDPGWLMTGVEQQYEDESNETVQPQTLQRVMRWKSTKMMDRYVTPSDQDARKAVNKI